MAANAGVSVGAFDFPLWCGKLSAALDFIIEDPADPNRQQIARLTRDEYDAAIQQKVDTPASNVVPLFSINDVIDELLPR